MQFGAKRCAQRARRRGAQGTMGGPNRPGQRAQDLQGRLTVSEGHGYPLVICETGIGTPKSKYIWIKKEWLELVVNHWFQSLLVYSDWNWFLEPEFISLKSQTLNWIPSSVYLYNWNPSNSNLFLTTIHNLKMQILYYEVSCLLPRLSTALQSYFQYYPVNNNNVAHINPSYTICPYYHHVKAIQIVMVRSACLWHRQARISNYCKRGLSNPGASTQLWKPVIIQLSMNHTWVTEVSPWEPVLLTSFTSTSHYLADHLCKWT